MPGVGRSRKRRLGMGRGGIGSWVAQDVPKLFLGSVLLSPTKHVIWQEQPGR